MICYNCKSENKEKAKVCKKCGADLTYIPWRPGIKWHNKVLGVIYAVVDRLLRREYFLNKADEICRRGNGISMYDMTKGSATK